jgi:hypothetical protein
MADFGFTSTQTINNGLTYMGAWNALTNNPVLTSSIGVAGQYYIVSVAGTTNLNGVTDWQVGDWAIFEGTSNQWQKIDNHDILAYSVIQNEGTPLAQQNTIDFQGAGVTASNGSGKTIVTIAGSPATTNYGLYSQTSSSTPISSTSLEASLIGSGLGTLSVPANGFQVGDAFRIDMFGHISSLNNTDLRIKIKANGVVLGDTGVLTLSQTTAKHWNLGVNFTIRAIGSATVASIQSSGIFNYSKNASNAFEGTQFVTIENTTFNTTIANTLSITAQWTTASASNSIYSDTFNLYKIY